MNENERMSVSVPISGIDTSTPDAIVADGKCERLHNLRFSGGSWRSVLEGPDVFAEFSTDYPFKLAYHHPANKETSYIAASTEQQYYYYKDSSIGKLVYLEIQEGSDIAKAYTKVGDDYIQSSNIIVNYDAKTKNFYNRTSELVSGLGLYDNDENPTGDQYITIGSKPKVGNAIYRYSRTTHSISEIGVINEVDKESNLFKLRVFGYQNNDDYDLDLVFVEEIDAEIPVRALVSTIPPNAVVSFSVNNNEVSDVQVLCVYNPAEKLSFDHFGKVLFIRRPELLTFVLKDEKYNFTDFSRIRFRCSEKESAGAIDDSFIAKGIGLPQAYVPGTNSATFLKGDCIYYPLAPRNRSQFLLRQFEANEWRGEICYFLTARMEDGTVIAVSPLFLTGNNPDKSMPIVVQEYNGEKVYCLYSSLKFSSGVNWSNSNGEPTQEQIVKNHRIGSNCPSVEFTVYTDNDNPLIHDIALYSTRILPTFDLSKIPALDDDTWKDVDSSAIATAGAIFSDTAKNLANEPFYFVNSIPWVDYKNGNKSFELSYETLERATGNHIFEPNANITPIIDFLSAKEYNNCMHFGGPTRKLPKGFVHKNEMIQGAGLPFESTAKVLFDGFRPDAPDDDRDYENDYEPDYGDYYGPEYDDYSPYAMRTTVKPIKDIVTRIVKANKRYYAVAENINPEENLWSINAIISYPDANANSMMFCTGLNAGEQGVEYALSPLNAINYAFHIFNSESQKFDKAHTPSSIESRTEVLKDIIPNIIFHEPNKLFVSATNNNFKLPFDQVYGIGTHSNQIYAINSAAIEMSDAKFGELPLYAFTKEGVYALQSGSGSVLYSAVIPINYDRIINPNTLAINYSLIYITEEGVKSISANQTTLLSQSINDADNKPILDYLRNAELFDFKPYSELIVHNPESDYAYILALKDGYWATRDFSGSRLSDDKVYIHDGAAHHRILDLAKRETGETIVASLKTRPLKFGSHEFKRLETFIPRLLAAGCVTLTIRFYGSTDRVNWGLMREVSGNFDVDVVIRRFPFSARYIYVEMDIDPIDVNASFDVSSMDMEYYLRFVRRMR